MDRQTKIALAALLMSALALSGCATSIADMPLSGTPADAPPRPKDASPWLPVNDLPRDRDEAAMDPAQRAKIQNELIAARDRQAAATAKEAGKEGGKDAGTGKETAKETAKGPATGTSSATATDSGAKSK